MRVGLPISIEKKMEALNPLTSKYFYKSSTDMYKRKLLNFITKGKSTFVEK
jgi:hypothetical protein